MLLVWQACLFIPEACTSPNITRILPTYIYLTHKTEIQAKSLGMKVEIFSPSGENIEDTGEPGELVCTRPHPSLPARFWGDEKGDKLRAAYYDTFPGAVVFLLWYSVKATDWDYV